MKRCTLLVKSSNYKDIETRRITLEKTNRRTASLKSFKMTDLKAFTTSIHYILQSWTLITRWKQENGQPIFLIWSCSWIQHLKIMVSQLIAIKNYIPVNSTCSFHEGTHSVALLSNLNRVLSIPLEAIARKYSFLPHTSSPQFNLVSPTLRILVRG